MVGASEAEREIARDLGKHDAHIDSLKQDVHSLRMDVHSMRGDLHQIQQSLSELRGVRRVIVALASLIGGAVSSVITYFFTKHQ
jgi:hypothetical protein